MIIDLIIGIILLVVFFLLLPLILAAVLWVGEYVLNPFWEWYLGILEGWYDNLKEGDDE